MTNFRDVIIAETPRDVVLFVTRGDKAISYPMLDRLYCTNNWINISNNLELLKLVGSMVSEGLIVEVGGGLRKGPNWIEPAFMTEKKYSFE
ncbi:hypothetical protein [Pseudomonas kulmbachensis]|uniref:hypothetical protein n=1 Tax=Pseudomonas kulmbachensis TaxID=3043408 RepID=UPI002AAF853E|nr:hypothetical protein [Pseudomonas sp. V3/3/4/13]